MNIPEATCERLRDIKGPAYDWTSLTWTPKRCDDCHTTEVDSKTYIERRPIQSTFYTSLGCSVVQTPTVDIGDSDMNRHRPISVKSLWTVDYENVDGERPSLTCCPFVSSFPTSSGYASVYASFSFAATAVAAVLRRVYFSLYIDFVVPFLLFHCRHQRSGNVTSLRHAFQYTDRHGNGRRPATQLLLLANVLVMMLSLPRIALAAPTSSREVSSVFSGRVFDGDASRRKNFDGAGYLMQYGYLPMSDLETGALRTDKELREAIGRFQHLAGLPRTERLDQATLDFMQKPRCGMADLLSSGGWRASDVRNHGDVHHERLRRGRRREKRATSGDHDHHLRPQQYVFGPSHWNKTQLTFRFMNFTSDMDVVYTRDAIYRALRLWSDVSRLTFHEVQTGNADIFIQFSTGYHQDGYPFDGPGMVLAHAFFPGEDKGGDMHFDEDETWTVYREEGVDLFVVAAHELGHSLGLAHSTVPDSIMFPWHQGYSSEFGLHKDDIDAIQQLYGAHHSKPDHHHPTHHRPTKTSPAPPTTTPTTHIEPVPPPTDRPHHELDDGAPDPCYTNFDAVSVIRGEIFAFKGKWFWRITNTGVMGEQPIEISRFWYGLPPDLDRVDAVYERSSDGQIVFFSGRRYWSFTGSERYPTGGRPLTDFGLPNDIEHVDAVFVWGHNRRTYIIAGGMYWKLAAEEPSTLSPVETHGYPRDMSMWSGVPTPVDAAFTSTNDMTYFFKGRQYWEFNNARMRIQRGYPRLIGKHWLNCSQSLSDDDYRSGNDEYGYIPGNAGNFPNRVVSFHFCMVVALIVRYFVSNAV